MHIGARPAVWEICAFSQKRPQEVQRISWRRHHPGVSIPSWTTGYCVVDGPLCRQTCWWLAGQPTALGRSLACVLQDVCLPHRSQALLCVDVLLSSVFGVCLERTPIKVFPAGNFRPSRRFRVPPLHPRYLNARIQSAKLQYPAHSQSGASPARCRSKHHCCRRALPSTTEAANGACEPGGSP